MILLKSLQEGSAMARGAILKDHIHKMVRAGHPAAVVLFGPEANQGCDFDFLVIEPSVGTLRLRGLTYRMAFRPRVIGADILVRTPEERRQAVVKGHLVIRATRAVRWPLPIHHAPPSYIITKLTGLIGLLRRRPWFRPRRAREQAL